MNEDLLQKPTVISGQTPHARHRRGKRVLAVRAMAGEIAWLEGQPRWQDGRIIWVTAHGTMVPSGADLALARRRLNQIARFPLAAAQALGNLPEWLARLAGRLELAKVLLALGVADLDDLARRARRGDQQAIERLVTWLVPEAYCRDGLPLAPSASLLGCGVRARPPLLALLGDTHLPAMAHALASLTLGAIDRRADGATPGQGEHLPAWIAHAYRWGLRHGLPAEPVIVALALRMPDGANLARRLLSAPASSNPFALRADMIREVLERGTPAALVALVEATEAAGALAPRILRYRDALPERPTEAQERTQLLQARHRSAVAFRDRRQGAVAELATLLRSYIQATLDGATVRAFTSFVHAMLDLAVLGIDPAPAHRDGRARKRQLNGVSQGPRATAMDAVIDTIVTVLRQGQTLSPIHQHAYLGLLVRMHARLWDDADRLARPVPADLAGWLERRRCRWVTPMLLLLRAGAAPAVVAEALQLGAQEVLAAYTWPDPDLYRLAVTAIAQLDLAPEQRWEWGTLRRLCDLVGSFPQAACARTALTPLCQALLAGSARERRHMLEAVLDALPDTQQRTRLLPILASLVPRLLRWASTDSCPECLCYAVAGCALALLQAMPDDAGSSLDWLLAYLRDHWPDDKRADLRWVLQPVIRLALVLAAGEQTYCMRLVTALLGHVRNADQDSLERVLPLLERYPALAMLLRNAASGQPRRCLDVLAHLGQAVLPELELPPLEDLALYWIADDRECPADWQPLLDAAPHMAPVATAYLRTQRMIGGSPRVPSGVRRALALPRRLADELTYLERHLSTRPALSPRVAGLRARLADHLALAAAARAEAAERLEQAVLLAGLAAAEHVVRACVRHRLQQVIGSLAPSTPAPVEEALLLATPFTTRVRANRGLLRRLLRSYAAGDLDALRRHPANRAFLDELGARGVEAGTWLGEHPRPYPCAVAAGGRVRVFLECDPLQVLRMGTLFHTCLSADGCNAHSAVANACELNKRVIYVRDEDARVIGRKLIGINEDGRLIGFRTYSLLSAEESVGVREIVACYGRWFAGLCGLELADSGTVPRLFAEDWYDDGALPWEHGERRDLTGLAASQWEHPSPRLGRSIIPAAG